MKLINIEKTINDLDNVNNEKELSKFFKKYRKVQFIDVMLVNYADNLIKGNDYQKGIMIIKGIYESKYFDFISDDITVYILLAKHYIENGDIEKGKRFLIKIANETTDNYEESLDFRGYLDIFNKYRHLVKDKIKKSVSTDTEEELSDDDLLELLLEEVHSGGYNAYLSYYSKYFDRTLNLAKNRKMELLVQQLERIQSKFPNNVVPDNAVNIIESNSLNFDSEDELFYNKICFEFDSVKNRKRF